ncbi:hypothetical protein PN466_03965 [Roseofilum reptotaenium CS-1145]|uniref:Uncharacterized protein n=1 Tax=Roseofilum reptotaenium AO1-A TaxID=1925591 RepID=A0A1L9QR13_9CYAN|nr:hypothetical protein [Roseofilum reptotaenium]MDB9516117.1 hypothetical protein [Roseofilum reptotaenium CS-1145]OJJ25066.1 hypothetical protein BI308_13580 [Roseofilum reptotaenium AO1-A]
MNNNTETSQPVNEVLRDIQARLSQLELSVSRLSEVVAKLEANSSYRDYTTPTDLLEIWTLIVDNLELEGIKLLVSKYCCLLEFEGGLATIGINKKGGSSLMKVISTPLSKAFENTFNFPVGLSFRLSK